jgi:Thermolysin metallopeptidase, alpha-helical domain/Thermolysin metallopeptidase, catalytic domain/Putative Ig domain
MIAATTFANADADATGHGYYYGSMNMESVYNSETELYELKDTTRGGMSVYDAGYAHRWNGNCRVDTCATNTIRPPLMTDDDNDWGDSTLVHPNVGQTQSVDAYYAAAKAWDYFEEVHGRRGVAGDGRGVALYVDLPSDRFDRQGLGISAGTALAGEDCDWRGDPSQAGPPDNLAACIYVQYGYDPLVSPNTAKAGSTLDLVGGAYSLAVVRDTAGLTGRPEGAGLAMATAHIFGTMIEFYANNAKDRPDYLIDEIRSPSTYWSMGDPGNRSYGTGSTLNRDNVSCWTNMLASHTDPEFRAGPADFFFFLLAAGGAQGSFPYGRFKTCDGRQVKGIGNAKAEKVWYRALTEYMDENTDYKGARVATLKAAADLYGAHGLEYNTVNSAWEAVSVRGNDPLPGASKPQLTNPGDQRTSLGASVNLQIEASDPRGQPLDYYIETDYEDPETGANSIPGLTVNPATGLITGKPTRKGSYKVSVTVTNGIAEATNTWFTWVVS